MFSQLFEKVSAYADHHQALFAVIVAISAVCFSWGIEKLLETYLFPNNPMYGYVAAIIGGLLVLWITQHFILHVF